MALIEIDRLRKVYAGSVAPAVDDLEPAREAGEFITLLGPSGSGKTTTLMLLAGFETPTSGTIRLEGRPIETLPPHRRGMGVVFQSYSLFPQMTVAQNVAFPLSVRKVAAATIRERVAAALAKVRLAHLAERKPQQLSGGQQQRVALARALVFEPRVVLMDEPLSALDKQLREEMQLEIRRLHRELGVTMVYVTHDQTEAMTLSDRVAVFNHGRIEQLASPQQLYDTPVEPVRRRLRRRQQHAGRPRRGRALRCARPTAAACSAPRRQHGGGRGGDAVRAPRAPARGRRRRCRQPLAGDAGRRHPPGRSLAAGGAGCAAPTLRGSPSSRRGAAARAWRPGRTCRWPSIANTPGCLRPESRRSRSTKETTMKRSLFTTLAAAAALALAGSAAHAQHDLTVVSWGGAYQDGQKEVFFKPFNATGTKLVDESWDGGLGVLRTKIKGGNNNWDVVQVEADELEVGCDEGLYEKLDVAKIGGAGTLPARHRAPLRRRRHHLQPGARLRRRQDQDRADRLGRLLRHARNSRASGRSATAPNGTSRWR